MGAYIRLPLMVMSMSRKGWGSEKRVVTSVINHKLDAPGKSTLGRGPLKYMRALYIRGWPDSFRSRRVAQRSGVEGVRASVSCCGGLSVKFVSSRSVKVCLDAVLSWIELDRRCVDELPDLELACMTVQRQIEHMWVYVKHVHAVTISGNDRPCLINIDK